MKTYLLKYNKPNTHTFYDIIKSKEQIAYEDLIEKEVDPEKKRKMMTSEDMKRFIKTQQDIVIYPGINEISEEHYGLMSKHPFFSHYFDSRPPAMEWVPGFGPEDETLKDFKSLKDNEALNIVESMWIKPVIEKYLAREKREKVKAALEAQLEKLKIKPAKAA